MQVDFIKMQGAGNDFVVLDERLRPLELTPAERASLANRRLGVGCDQLIVLQQAGGLGVDAFLRFFNADGSESAACGNGTRCAAALLMDETGLNQVRLRSIAGDLPAHRGADGAIRVDMGAPGLGWEEVPLSRPQDTLHLDLPGAPASCSMGNPHATFFVEALDEVDVTHEGAALEQHDLFAQGANIGFAQLLDAGRMRLAVWERGSGLTPACGSGACAAVVNAHRRGLVGRECRVEMPGGVLDVLWREDGHVLLGGPTQTVFSGRIGLSR